MMGQLMGAATEYKEQTGKFVTFDIDGDTYDATSIPTNDARSINFSSATCGSILQPALEAASDRQRNV